AHEPCDHAPLLVRASAEWVGDTGFEPVTSSVSRKRATAAPIARTARWVRDSNPCIRLCRPLPRLSANPPGDDVRPVVSTLGPPPPGGCGTRTRDPHLGKVMLYQLSHIRMSAVPPEGDRCDVEDSSVRVEITSNRRPHVLFLRP